MRHLFYTTSESAWKGILSSIEKAHTSIYIEMYIFVDDTHEADNLVNVLAAKAQGGVAVRMVLDAFGSNDLSKEALEKLKNAGVEVLFFKKLFRRLHRKMIIIDEKVGFIGGVNIHRSAKKWSDLFMRVEGRIVHSFVRSFRKVYKACGGKDSYIMNLKKKALLPQARVWLLEQLPSIRKPRLKDAYSEALLQATKKVTIVTPYFIPHFWLRKILSSLEEQHIEVEVIVPATTDIGLITRANRCYMSLMTQKGVQFFLTPEMNHAKLLLVDEKLALVSSHNIDALSFDFNAEIGLFFSDEKMIQDLSVIIAKWKSKATPFDPKTHISLWDRVVAVLVRILQPFL